MKAHRYLLFFLTLLFLLGLVIVVLAQTSASLTLSTLELNVGTRGVIEAAIDCRSTQCSLFDISVEYDPLVIRVDNVVLSDYLGDVSQGKVLIVSNVIDNENGHLRLAAVAIGTPPEQAIDQAHTLFSIYVTALSVGESTLTVTHLDLGDTEGRPLSAGITYGIVQVNALPTATATATPRPPMLLINGTAPIRQEPDLDIRPFRRVISQQAVPILRVVDFGSWRFYQVQIQEVVGWILHTRNITVLDDLSGIPVIVYTNTPTPTPTATPDAPFAIVNVASANLRRGPGTEYGVVRAVRRGVSMQVLARTPNLVDPWYLVRTSTYGNVWIAGSVVTLTNNARVQDIPVAATLPANPGQ